MVLRDRFEYARERDQRLFRLMVVILDRDKAGRADQTVGLQEGISAAIYERGWVPDSTFHLWTLPYVGNCSWHWPASLGALSCEWCWISNAGYVLCGDRTSRARAR